MNFKNIDKSKEVGQTVSLYSGAGGLDIGFHLAGFNCLWANDIDKYATHSYQSIFPNNTVTTGNILDQHIPLFKNVDLVVGGPPCQGFSVAGKMDPNDPRSRHVWNFLNIVDKLSPRGFVMENVKALAQNSRWEGLRIRLVKEAEKMGYKVRLLLLNAADFGVPQARERMFLIGLKEGGLSRPVPITKGQPFILKDALKDIPRYGTNGNDSICTAKITPAANPILRKSPFAGMLFNGQGRPLNLYKPALTLPASMGGNRTPIVDQTQIENDSQHSWIIDYHRHLMKGGKPYKEAPKELRRITVEEAAVIQTFPQDMTFYGTLTNRFRQIGNAVPPILSYHVALSVRKALNLN